MKNLTDTNNIPIKIKGIERNIVTTVLEDLQDRAALFNSFPPRMHLSEFTDYVRSLYPELYKRRQS